MINEIFTLPLLYIQPYSQRKYHIFTKSEVLLLFYGWENGNIELMNDEVKRVELDRVKRRNRILLAKSFRSVVLSWPESLRRRLHQHLLVGPD